MSVQSTSVENQAALVADIDKKTTTEEIVEDNVADETESTFEIVNHIFTPLSTVPLIEEDNDYDVLTDAAEMKEGGSRDHEAVELEEEFEKITDLEWLQADNDLQQFKQTRK